MREKQDPELPSLFATTPRRWAVAGEVSRARGEADERNDAEAPGAAVSGLELFQSPSVEDGYERWKAEAARMRAAEAESRRAQELPVQTDGEGYAVWKAEVEAAKRTFEQRWGVPLGKPVRVLLRGEAVEREGRLSVVEEAKQGKALRLRLGTEVFEAGRIESVVRVDEWRMTNGE